MLQIKEGMVKRPLRVVIDGVEGVGKTTFASGFPNPLFIDLEKGTHSLNVRRTQVPETWTELMEIVRDVIANPSVCRTLVIDTGDWAEHLCEKDVCETQRVSGIESVGYGKGYTYLRETFAELLALLDKVIDAGVNVVMCCHTQIKKFELPDEQGSFDRYELKLSKQVSPLVREWCDIQLFANFKTYVIETQNKQHKGTGGTRRVMYSNHTASWDAKNRHGLPDEMDFDFGQIAHLFESVPTPQKEKPIDKLKALMEEAGITEDEIRKVVAGKGHYPAETPITEYTDKFITGWLLKYWGQVTELLNKGRAESSPVTETETGSDAANEEVLV